MSHWQLKLSTAFLSNQKRNLTFAKPYFSFIITLTIFRRYTTTCELFRKMQQGCLCAFLEWTWMLFFSGFSLEVLNSWGMMSTLFANVETSDIYFICFCHVNKRKAAKGYGRRFANCRHPGRAVCSIIPQWVWGSDVYIKSTRERGVQDQGKIVRRGQLNTRTW
jgi:hypothetical protein